MQRRFAILLLLAALYVASAVVVDVVVKPKECPKEEEWHLCGKLCEPTCLVQEPRREFCPAIVCTNFTADCRCKDRYVRDIEGLCIKPKDCKKQ